jgi:hypothetical protein
VGKRRCKQWGWRRVPAKRLCMQAVELRVLQGRTRHQWILVWSLQVPSHRKSDLAVSRLLPRTEAVPVRQTGSLQHPLHHQHIRRSNQQIPQTPPARTKAQKTALHRRDPNHLPRADPVLPLLLPLRLPGPLDLIRPALPRTVPPTSPPRRPSNAHPVVPPPQYQHHPLGDPVKNPRHRKSMLCRRCCTSFSLNDSRHPGLEKWLGRLFQCWDWPGLSGYC